VSAALGEVLLKLGFSQYHLHDTIVTITADIWID
jgi:hypothetical protein